MKPGTLIGGRFELVARTGTGGMGTVWRARDRLTQGFAAVKVMEVLDSGLVARFVRESRVLSELRHPGVVRHLDHGELATGGRYLAMEWLAGMDLATRLEAGPLSVRDALILGRAVAEAVGTAHARGVIHRDLKPSNIFLVGNSVDRVKVLDFGIAASARLATAALTRTGVALGTPGYMPPEQARGQKDLDARADVYGLGCVLYQAISGRPPYSAENLMAALVKSVLEETPHLSEVFEQVPPEVDALVHRLMAKEPELRPRDGQAVVEAIDALGEVRDDESTADLFIRPPTLTAQEQRLICVLLVAAAEGPRAGADAPTRDTLITAPGALADPEAQREAEELVRTLGGRMESLVGGAFLVTFEGGTVPTDLVARAARCALSLRQRFGEAAIVLSTGRGATRANTSEGEVVNRAVHLLELAQANPDLGPSILIDETSFAILEGHFEIFCTLLGYVLIGERDALHAERKLLGRSTPCVGRTRELGTLTALFEECVGEPVARAALLTGPAGTGKSRIRQELVRQLRERGEAFTLWIARGDEVSEGSPLSVLAELVRGAAEIPVGEDAEAARARLARWVGRRLGPDDALRVTQFLAEMLGVPFEQRVLPYVHAARGDSLVMGDQLRRAFEDLVAAECAVQPVLLVLEDLQWSDLSTLQFVDAALRNLHDRPLMVLGTGRPDVEDRFGRLWAERGAQEIRVGPLTPRASRQLVEHVAPQAADVQVARMVARAGGHPLLLEELLRALHDHRQEALPDTALALVEARVYALDNEARRVLRAASVFGRSFWAGGVASLISGQRAPGKVGDWLTLLEEDEWIVRRKATRFPGEVEYGFSQDVVREALYAMLTHDDRGLGHRLAGEWLEEAGERDHVVLARHFEAGGEAARAVARLERAAEQALDGNDFRAVVQHCERAIRLHGGPAAPPPRRGSQAGVPQASTAPNRAHSHAGRPAIRGRLRALQAEAHLHAGALEPALEAAIEALALKSAGSPGWCRAANVKAQAAGKLGQAEAVREVSQALLTLDPDASTEVAFAAAGAATVVQLLIAGEMALATEMAARLERLEAESAAKDPALVGHVTKAVSARWAFGGDPGRTLPLLRKAVDAFEAAGDARSVCSLRKTQGWYAAECGALEEGERALLEAVALAERLGLHSLAAHARYDAASPLIRLGKLDEARAMLTAAHQVFAEEKDLRLTSGTLGCLAWVDSLQGHAEPAVARARQAVEIAPSPPVRIAALAFLAQAQLVADRPEDALHSADEGLELLSQVGLTEEGTTLLGLVRAEALQALGYRTQAVEALTDACRRLRERAEKISDVALRATFLSRIGENRRTLELAEAWQGGPEA
ncbi:MAG: protein kinase [Deltaproteobacteria bacterium]|nr:protein kinase [Deltaproteobacteria bacterium]